MIYFIESADGTAIKIGRAADVGNRLSMLQTANHLSLTLLGALPWPDAHEPLIHKQWEHLRVRGEWFEATDELRRFIAAEIAYEAYERGVADSYRRQLALMSPR